MKCPRCPAEPLDDQTLDGKRQRGAASPYRTSPALDQLEALAGEIWVSRCRGCDGVWFDAQELAQAMRSMKIIDAPDPPADIRLNANEPCHCPRCHVEMKVTVSRAVPGVVYDRCGGCGGIWLDAGELRHLADPLVALSAFVAREFG